jgi:hypothetical protein
VHHLLTTVMARRRRASRVALAAGILPLLGTACRTGSPPADPLTVRDSSGVHIVESSRSDGDDAWRVPDPPVFRIGGQVDGLHFYLLEAAVLRPDGSSVVGDAGSATTYLISASGEILLSLRGEGEGPGETLEPSAIIGLGGDTILVQNAPNLRVETFVGDRLVRDVPFAPFFGETSYTVFGRTDDGRFLLSPTGFSDGAFEGPVGWKDFPILRTGTDFSSVDTVASVPVIYVMPPGDRNPVRHSGERMWTGHRLVYAANDRAEVHWLSLDGSNMRVVRWTATTRQPDEEVWNEYEAGYRRRYATLDSLILEQRLAEARRDFSGPLPLFRAARADPEENVWLADYRIASRGADSYLAVTPEGGLHRVDFPAAVRILDVADTLVLGVEENDPQEQTLVLYRVEKSRP